MAILSVLASPGHQLALQGFIGPRDPTPVLAQREGCPKAKDHTPFLSHALEEPSWALMLAGV